MDYEYENAKNYIMEIIIEGCSTMEILKETLLLVFADLEKNMNKKDFHEIMSLVQNYHNDCVEEFKKEVPRRLRLN